jgi:hypothetical protein
MHAKQLNAIDTFSGIGGVSLALKDIVRTVLYCEINPYCQRVLSERMAEKKIDPAPIHGDIKTLHVPDSYNIKLITGGSPCTDISSIGLKQGIVQGPQSRLFYEILRLADELPTVEMLFLENVANILRVGIRDVIEELTVRRDYDMYWTVKSAAGLGAPHVRKRWFCLAVKRGNSIDFDTISTAMMACHDGGLLQSESFWAADPTDPPVSIRPAATDDNTHDNTYDNRWVNRAQCLGNTVVPCVVRAAFQTLVKMHKMAAQLKDLLGDQCGQSVSQLLASTEDPAETCAIVDKCCVPVPSAPTKLSPNTSSRKWTIRHNDKEITLTNLPTPRHGVCHASSVTDRSLHDLPTILVHNDAAKSYVESKLDVKEPTDIKQLVVPNVRYIEWMMGYPRDWTKVEPLPERPNPHPKPSHAPASHHASRPSTSITNPQRTINALNLFHQERHPKGNLKDVCKMWRELSADEKRVYSERAREIRKRAAS